MKERPLFFILGRERSGTTLLQNLLNNHPEIFVPNEAPFISFLYPKYSKKKNICPKQFVKDIFLEPYIFLWEIDKSKLLAQLEATEDRSFSNFCKIVLDYHNSKNAKILGDKNPVHSLFGNILAATFPDAKFIWITRDYRAQVNSMLKVNFERKNVASLAIRWKIYNKEIEKLQQKFPEKVMHINYEDLVVSPKIILAETCTFLGTNYLEGMNLNEDAGNKRIAEHHKSLQKNINSENLEDWKTELTDKQQLICEVLAGEFGKQFGYERLHSKKNIPWDPKGVILGCLYVPFLKAYQKLPVSWKNWLGNNIIRPNFDFWKKTAQL
ncbi:MAG TPA: sulfotransferase [Flavobacteriaceae bacterium]|nr:sulfotransferase [Flavobacteriaceae bacterium]